MTQYRGDEGGGGWLLGSGNAQALKNLAKGRTYKEDNSQKTARDGAAQKRVKRAQNGEGQEIRNIGTNPLSTRRG